MNKPNVGETMGIIRHLDDLGRIVLPKEMRRQLKFNTGDAMEIFSLKDRVYIRKVEK